jgi:hypothetical protein
VSTIVPHNHQTLVAPARLDQDEPSVARNIDILNELHRNHYTRYPHKRAAPVPDASVIADSTVDHLIDTFTQTINPR